MPVTGHVQRVKDGDTLDVRFADGVKTVRVWGIDAPESSQPFGPHATEAAARLVGGKTVEVGIRKRGPYGRIIGRVRTDGYALGPSLVKNGYAWSDRKYGSTDHLYALEQRARHDGEGLWAQDDPVPPWHYRDRAPHVQQEEIGRSCAVFLISFLVTFALIVFFALAA